MDKTIKFNAGEVVIDKDTNKCTPLPHKGVVTIEPNPDEPSFFDMNWVPKSSSSKAEESGYLLIPGEFKLKKIQSCNTGRIICFTNLNYDFKILFWLQDPGDDTDLGKWTEKDEKLFQKLNDVLFTGIENTQDNDKDDKMEQDSAVKEEAAEHHPRSGFPIYSISDVLTPSVIRKHLESLNTQELEDKYKDFVPEGTQCTVEDIMDVIRNAFYQQSEAKLSTQLRDGSGAGYLLAQILGYEYNGENIENFLDGVRRKGKMENEN